MSAETTGERAVKEDRLHRLRVGLDTVERVGDAPLDVSPEREAQRGGEHPAPKRQDTASRRPAWRGRPALALHLRQHVTQR